MEKQIRITDAIGKDSLYTFNYTSIMKLKILGIFALAVLTFLLASYSYTLALLSAIFIVYIAETHSGIVLNMETKQYKDFQSVFGYKRGEWRSFKEYPFLTVKMVTGVKKYTRIDGFAEIDIKDKRRRFDLLLSNESHRKTIFLKSFKTEGEALDFAYTFEENTGLIYQSYNPKISAATMARKRKSRFR